MEPAAKRAKLTDHFRVALRPQDLNTQLKFEPRSKVPFGKENVEVITILDDKDDENKQQQQASQQSHLATYLKKPISNHQNISQSQPQLQQTQQQQQHQTQVKALKNHNFESSQHKHSSQPKQQFQPQFLSLLKPQSQSQPKQLQNQQLKLSQLLQQQQTKPPPITQQTQKPKEVNLKQVVTTVNRYFTPPGLLSDLIDDHDRTLVDDVRCEPHYAWDSFKYDREQELRYKNCNYFDDGKLDHDITPHKRAELVDWLVSIQNQFELDHEPLYMAVKLADQYLMKKVVHHENLELLFMTSILISAKFDERLPPISISELIHATRHRFGIVYQRQQLISLEVDMLKTLNFDIRFPLSYGFLRRFARCTRSDKKTLNLARYILESSLLEHDMIEILESKMAAGSLLLAFQMLHINEPWTETARYYTGYEHDEIYPLSVKLNQMLMRLSRKNSAIRRKYSHEFFMEVARIPPVSRAPDNSARF